MRRCRSGVKPKLDFAHAGHATSSGGPQGAPAGAAAASAPERRNPNIITRDELLDTAIRSQNVLEVVKSLRPHFLTMRGTSSIKDQEAGKVHASINGMGVVALDELRNILVSSVVDIQFLNSAAAMQRFGGAAHQGPVIVVRLM